MSVFDRLRRPFDVDLLFEPPREVVDGEVVTVYPGRRRVLARLLGGGAALCFLSYLAVAWLIEIPFSGWWVILLLCLFGLAAAGVVGLARNTLECLRQLRSAQPSLRLDSDGLECAAGRVLWSDVERVAEYVHATDDTRRKMLLLSLREGTQVYSTTAGRFSEGFLEVHKLESGLAVDYWGPPESVRKTIAHFYRGPIEPQATPRAAPTQPNDVKGEPLERTRRDRPALVAIGLVLVILLATGGTAAYLSWKAFASKEKGSGKPVATLPAAAGASYAGLTEQQARTAAVSDWARFLKRSRVSLPQGATLATEKGAFIRTRCFETGRWGAYWKVTFAGGSPIFESKKLGLLYCNRDQEVTELSPSLEH